MSEQDISESPDIRFVGVSKWFGDVVAVDKIDEVKCFTSKFSMN